VKYLNVPNANLPEVAAPGYPSAYPAMPGASASAEQGELNVAKYLSILRKNLWVIIGIILCSTLVAGLVSWRAAKIYEAVAKVNVDREPPQILSFKDIVQDNFDYEMYIETQIRVLQSNTLALKTIQDLKLASHAGFIGEQAASAARQDSRPWTERQQQSLINRFVRSLRIVRIRGSQLVEVRFMCFDPALARDVANELAENFIEHNLQGKYDATIKASEWLKGQLEDLKQKVEKSEEELVAYQRANQILMIDERTDRSTTMDKLADMNRSLTSAEIERQIAESKWRVFKEQGSVVLSASPDHALNNLRTKLNDVNQQLADLGAQYGENHPKFLKLKAQREQMQSDYDREMRRLAEAFEAEYKITVVKEQNARKLFLQAKAEAESQNDKSIQYNILKRDVESNRQMYNGLLQRLKEAGVSAGLRSSNISIVDRASMPLAPTLPRTGQNISLGVIIGTILGLLAAMLRHFLDNTVKTPDDVEQFVGLPNLGVIPGISPGVVRAAYYAGYGMAASQKKQLHAGGRQELEPRGEASAKAVLGMCRPETVALSHPHSSIAESFRALRTALLLANSGMPPRTVLVTSGLPSEGKTTIAINVAITLAQRGGKVLLVDADLRRPSIHRHMISQKKLREELPGISEYLTGNASLEECKLATEVSPNLEVVFAGAAPPNPAELCSSEQMRRLLHELREQYSHVVIDSPPLLSVTDATILSVQTDGVLLVSRSGFSTRDSLRRAKRLLDHVNARILGVVLNDLNLAVDGYYYYYYYGYYGYGRPEKGVRDAPAGS
jgi:capsular exopolysaccharide synthesis family protein